MARRALLCGINNYKSVRDLRGCVRDVENMRSLLQEVYGFQDDEIRVLLDQEVIKTRLKAEWKWLFTGAGPGDTLLFHFSGHGSFLPDRQGEEEDGNDELLCLYDMDFKKPGSYLLDDEFNEWIAEKPEGADLVLVTDCCHSGTNTRMVLEEVNGRMVTFALDTRATFHAREAAGASAEPREVVARFLPPPNYLPAREAAMRPPVRRNLKPLNHLHLAACQDSETAADAPLDGQYHGAFTHYLCKALRAEPNLDSTRLVAQLATSLAAFPLAQRPQENGGPRRGPLFGRGVPTAPRPVREGELREETARELLVALRDLTSAFRGTPLAAAPRHAGRRILVYVHGIDEHPGDYSLPWWKALRPHLDGLFGEGTLGDTRVGVHWSDIVNPRALALPQEPGAGAALLKQLLERELEERSARYADTRRAARSTLTRGGGPQIDDFLRYMLQASVREQVLDRFTSAVRPLLASGASLDLVTHSWGTVVAYEGLLQLEPDGHSGRVANFFTVGSALSLGLVRWQLGLGDRRPAQVARWVNLDAKGDSIGGDLSRHFPIDHEYLELDPTGCTRGWFGYNLSCAHGSYFREENVHVNRDLFAWHMREA